MNRPMGHLTPPSASAAGGANWGEIGGTLSNQGDLSTALAGKSATTHHHDGVYAPAAHGHIIADTTGLQTALDGKAASAHNHAGVYDPAGTASTAVSDHAAAADPHTGYQKESEKAVANGYASLGIDGKVPAAQLPAGSDPWTYLRLTSDFTISTTAAGDITGLAFTPAANQRYEFVARLMVRTAAAATGPRPGVAWATGMADGVVFIQQTSSATANVFANGNINAAVLAPVGGLPNATQSWPALVEGMVIAGASPSGTVRLQLASESAGTIVTAIAGSFLKYRTIP